jgi:hypothetical protein
LKYEIRNKYDAKNKRNPPRTKQKIREKKLIALANHVAAHTYKRDRNMDGTDGDYSRLKYIIKSNVYLLILRFHSQAYIDVHFSMMPSMQFVAREAFERYCIIKYK